MRLVGWLAAGAMGCGNGGERCLDSLPSSCTPQYTPGFDAVYDNTVAVSCAVSGCHGGDDAAGGLALGDTRLTAFDGLAAVITPGDAACSLLVDHLEPEGLGDMPPGRPLDEGVRCAIRMWIDAGADGPAVP